MELDDILKNDEPAKPETETAVQAELPVGEKPPVETVKSSRAEHQAKEKEAQDAGRKRNADGTFAANEEAPDEAKPEAKEPVKEPVKEQPKVELTDKEKAFLADALKERKARQELERQVAALTQQRQAPPPQQQPQGEQVPAQTFWDNPDAALQQIRSQIMQETQQTVLQTKVTMSADMARSRYPDFDEKVAAFVDMMKVSPWLEQQVASSPNPAEAAYRLGKNGMELRQAGDLDGFRKKVEDETRAAVRKELADEQAAKEAARLKLAESLPRSLTDVRGSTQTAQVWGGPTPLDAILKH